MATSPIDLSGGFVPKQNGLDLSAGFVPKKEQPEEKLPFTVANTPEILRQAGIAPDQGLKETSEAYGKSMQMSLGGGGLEKVRQELLPVAAGVAAKLPPNVKALGKLGAQDALSHIPVAGRLVRRPSIMDYVKAARTQPEPVYPGAPFPEAPPTYPGAPYPENPGTFPGAPLPAKPSPELLQGRALARGGAAPPEPPSASLGRVPLAKQMQTAPQSANPVNVTGRMPYPAGRNIDLSPGMETPGGAVVAPRTRGLLPAAPEAPAPRLVDQVKATPPASAPPTSTWPPEEPNWPRVKSPGGIADTQEDQGIQQEIQERQGRSNQNVYREKRAASDPSTPKGTLIEQMGGKPVESAIKYTKTPRATGPRAKSAGTPATDDLEPILKKSVAWVAKKKGSS